MPTEDLQAIAKLDSEAYVSVAIGDVLEYRGGEESWWGEWWAPDPYYWAEAAVSGVMEQLRAKGLNVFFLGKLEWEVDDSGLGTTYRLQPVRLRVDGFIGPDGVATTEGGAIVLPVQGTFGDQEYVEASATRAVVLVLALLLGGSAFNWTSVMLVRTLGDQAPGVLPNLSDAAKLVAVAAALGALWLLVHEVRR